MEVFETAQSTIFREIKVIPGFGTHPDLAKWIADIKQNGVDNRKSSKRQSEEPKTDNSVPYYPLPVEVAWALREIEVIHIGCVDNYIDSANPNPMSRFQHQVFSEGVKNSMSKLKLTQSDWDGIIERSTKMASGEAGAAINLFTHYRFRVHLEALRLLRGKSLMEILYLGEINVKNEFSEAEEELYVEICEQIWSMVQENPDMDISQLTLENLQKEIKVCSKRNNTNKYINNKIMKNETNRIRINDTSPRTFTFSQLFQISDDNYGVLNRCIDMSKSHADDIFVLYPVMEHHHAFGEEVDSHLRTRVKKLDEDETLAFQDLTYDQWDQGKELNKTAC